MSARSMYQTIMDLPLFKGVSEDHVSSFLEKTRVDFKKYAPGEIIIEAGEEVRILRFLIRGKIRKTFTNRETGIIVSSVMEDTDVLGISRLFGLHLGYGAEVVACTDVSMMEFEKAQYLNLLQSDPIYLMNFANLLSYYSQRLTEEVKAFKHLGLTRVIAEYAALYTDRRSEQICLTGKTALSSLYGKELVEESLKDLIEAGIIIMDGDIIIIPDRERIISFVSDFDV